MLERIKDVPASVVGIKATGKVSSKDYQDLVQPMLDEARRDGRRVRFLYQVGPEFEGFTPGAAWEDAKVGLHFMRLFDGCAVVTDVGWIRDSVRLASFLMPCPVRVFAVQDRDKAVEWLASLPQGPGVSHRLLPDAGVMVVEIREALRAQDFDAVAATADMWIEAHGDLQGLVIHARDFPGWQNLAGLVRHLRFVRDHHRKIKRIALVADTEVASLAPRLAEHFVASEIKAFPYADLDRGIEWAAGAPRRNAPISSEKT
jgi:hypothetical protein